MIDDLTLHGTINTSTGMVDVTGTSLYPYGWPLGIIIFLLSILVCLMLFRRL